MFDTYAVDEYEDSTIALELRVAVVVWQGEILMWAIPPLGEAATRS